MRRINTVSGSVQTDELGVTYMHEHIFVVSPEFQHYWPGYAGWDREQMIERARAVLSDLHDTHGVTSILDPTVPGMGRDVRAVAAAVEGTGINVIAATGWYTYSELPITFLSRDHEGRIEELIRLFTYDIEEGLDGTDIKPGVIKCSTALPGLTPDVEALLRAAARTHVRSGLPITTHTDFRNEGGLIQQRIFREEGVDLGAVVIGHCNESNDIGYMEKLIDGGSFIGFDRCASHSEVASLDVQIDNLAELCHRGYADRVVLSHDHAVFFDLLDDATLATLLKFENYPYMHLEREMLPRLREAGVTDEQVHTMLVKNPRAYFERGANGAGATHAERPTVARSDAHHQTHG